MYPRSSNPFLGADVAAPAGAQVDPGMPFSYGVELLPLAANGNQSPQVQVVNHDFKAYFLMAQSNGAFKAKIRIGDRYLSNIPIHSANLFGTGQNPMPLLAPITVRKNDIIIFEITDLSGADNNVRIALVGVEASN